MSESGLFETQFQDGFISTVSGDHELIDPALRYSTPSSPTSVDFPSMTPTATMIDVKRPRTLSRIFDSEGRIRAYSFDMDTDFEHMWDSLGDGYLAADMVNPLLASELGSAEANLDPESPQPHISNEPPIKHTAPPKRRSNSARPPPQRAPSRSSTSTKLPVRKSSSSGMVSCPTQTAISACTPGERQVKLQRFLEKRKRRVWRKEVKYSCRKQFAESRPRVAGRFVPKNAVGAPGGVEESLARMMVEELVLDDSLDSLLVSTPTPTADE